MRALTSAVAAGTLIGGFAVAQSTGNRPLGGVVLLAGGAFCAMQWWRSSGPMPAAVNSAVFTAAFIGSHPLAKEIGAWPAVLAVSAATAGISYAIAKEPLPELAH